jgi:hypothetical protein
VLLAGCTAYRAPSSALLKHRKPFGRIRCNPPSAFARPFILQGGQVYIPTAGSFSLEAGSALVANFAGGDGGAVSLRGMFDVRLVNATCERNRAGAGGNGGCVSLDRASSVLVQNAVLTGNSADSGGSGGAIDITMVRLWAGEPNAQSSAGESGKV